jgi:hypothetical protein
MNFNHSLKIHTQNMSYIYITQRHTYYKYIQKISSNTQVEPITTH